MAGEHELPKGQYKSQPNHVRLKDGTFHAYAPVDQVSTEMHRLIEQLRSPEFAAAHPVLQASWVHYAFVAIHPFADGNGRVARALASVYFYRACSIPFLVFANQKPAYLDALHEADLGNLRPLLTFFRDRGIDTMQLVVDNIFTPDAPAPELAAARLKELIQPLSGLSHHALDSIALRLLSEVESRTKNEFERLGLPKEIALKITRAEDGRGALPGYRRLTTINPKPILIVLVESHSPPARAVAEDAVRVLVASSESIPFAFLLETVGNANHVEIRLDEVHPEHTSVLDLRLDGWTRKLLGRLLMRLEQQGRDSLKKNS